MRPCLARRIATSWARAPALARGPIRPRCRSLQALRHVTSATQSRVRPADRYRVFKRTSFPSKEERQKPETWTRLLEPGLPPHLRPQGSEIPTSLDAVDVAEILLTAQHGQSEGPGVDVLFHLGMVEGRWAEVVWIVKLLVENYSASTTSLELPQRGTDLWSQMPSLEESTEDPIELLVSEERSKSQVFGASSLEDFTNGKPTVTDNAARPTSKEMLGQVWRSLGNMTIACEDGVVKPEILEIIAYLHHEGIMPTSIYSQKPRMDVTAIQQPPTLHLLSSRILVALSDAAWRAHEKLIVSEAKLKGGNYAALRPEIPGSAYRVRVAGLRSEIWLELILWACLHGGWTTEGAAILRAVAQQRPLYWLPLSWRHLSQPGDQEPGEIERLFQSRTHQSRSHDTTDRIDESGRNVARTISSEVVNAYVDALLCALHSTAGGTSVSMEYVLEQLNMMRGFLARSGLKLNAGSWDAVVLRIAESQGPNNLRLKEFLKLRDLSPGFGTEVTSVTTQDLPTYVLDGSAALVGVAHCVLCSAIEDGNFAHAIRVVKALVEKTDVNKRKSLEDFFQTILNNGGGARESGGIFDSNYPMIDYPLFEPQIPPTILGPLLELVTDSGALDDGRWLLYNDEIDGPLIPEGLYHDPAITPSLLMFAAATKDSALMAKALQAQARHNAVNSEGPTTPHYILQSMFDTQVVLGRWDAATRIVDYMIDIDDVSLNVVNVAYVARAMLRLRHSNSPKATEGEKSFAKAKTLFALVCRHAARSPKEPGKIFTDPIDLLTGVLASVEPYWARFCLSIRDVQRYMQMNFLSVKAFNLVLQGVLNAYDTNAGMKLLDDFWPEETRRARMRTRNEGQPDALPQGPNPLLRTVVKLPGHYSERLIVYGGLRPSIMTIRYVLQSGLEEIKQRGYSAERAGQPASSGRYGPRSVSGSNDRSAISLDRLVTWTRHRFHCLGMTESEISEELQCSLTKGQLAKVDFKSETESG